MVFIGIHEGFAVFFQSQWQGLVSGTRKICYAGFK